MAIALGTTELSISVGSTAIGKVSIGDTLVFSAGSAVTYKVDVGVSYIEEVDSGGSCLSPTTFTPTKNGYTFVGWREDSTASSSVLTSKIMDSEPITLYAVFKKTVVVTYYNGSTSASTVSGSQYYNNGIVVSPTFTIAQATKSGWITRGWSKSSVGDASVAYSTLNKTVITESVTLYGLYYQTITLTTVANGTSATSSGTRYYNSAGNYVNPTFTVANPTKSGAAFKGWSSSASSASITNSSISGLSLSANTTRYAVFKADDSVILTVSGYWEESITNVIATYNADLYYGVAFSNIWLRTGTTNTSQSSYTTLTVGGVEIANANTNGGIVYKKDLGTYDLSSLSGNVNISGTSTWWGSLVCDSGTGAITALGRTVVG